MSDALKRFVRTIAPTGLRIFYLGRGKGSSQVVPTETFDGPMAQHYRAQRMVYIFDERGNVSLAVLDQDSGILYRNYSEIAQSPIAVITYYPPASSVRHVSGLAPEALELLGGETLAEKTMNVLTFPKANQIATFRATTTQTGDSLIVEVGEKGYYETPAGLLAFWPGGTYDATNDRPSTADYHRIGILVIDSASNALAMRLKTSTANSMAPDPHRAAFSALDFLGITLKSGDVPIVGVYLYNNQVRITEEDFYRGIDFRFRMYAYLRHNHAATAAPGTGDDADDGYGIGSRWLDLTNDKAYLCLDATVGAAVWKQISNDSLTLYYQTVQDEGTPVTQRGTLNFTGAGVTVSDNGGSSRTDVSIPALTVEETDGSPSVTGVTKIKVSGGTLTDNGSGTVTIATGGGSGSVTVEETDGTPSVSGVSTIKVTNGKLTDNGSGVVTLDLTGTAGTVLVGTNGGRLTGTSGTPVTTSDVTAITTLYFTPFIHNQIALYDGSSAWSIFTFSELSLSLSGYTNALPYDIWAYDNSGSVALESTAWTNTTTRATALTTVNGVYCKSGATTRRYLGTIYMSATSQTEDSYSKRYVFNWQNKVRRPMKWSDGTSHTYNSATPRYWNNSSSSIVSFIQGVIDQHIDCSAAVYTLSDNGKISPIHGMNINANNTFYYAGFDGTTTSSSTTTVGVYNAREHRGSLIPTLGYNYIAFVEAAGSPAPTFYRAMLNAWINA